MIQPNLKNKSVNETGAASTTLTLFQKLYQDLSYCDPTVLDQIYSDSLVYRDPLRTIQGLGSYKKHLNTLNQKISHGGFCFTDISQFENDTKYFFTWQLDMQLMDSTQHIKTAGITEIWVSNHRITSHRDYLESAADHI